jgi:uncharacterized protein YjaZ
MELKMSQKVFFAKHEGLNSSQIERILSIANDTVTKVAAILPISQTDILLHVRPSWTIPEFGIGGFSPSAAYALIHFDPAHSYFDTNIENELAATIAHELHHCARYGGMGYGNTLLGALVTEGLACAFEKEFRNGQTPIYAKAIDTSQQAELLSRAKLEFNNSNYVHHDWFFGSRELEIPKWTGYTLGYEIVQLYLEQNNVTAASQWNTPTSNFFFER